MRCSWIFSFAVSVLLLLATSTSYAQPQIEESGADPEEGADASDQDAGDEDADGQPAGEDFGKPAKCLGIRDGLLEASDASHLADAICRSVTRNGIPMGEVSQDTGSDTELRLLLTMNEEGQVKADWTLTESGEVHGSGERTWPNYNAAMAGATEFGREISQAKHGPNLSEGFNDSYFWTNFALLLVVAAGVGEFGIGLTSSIHGQIERVVIKLSGRFAFNPTGSLFVGDGTLDIGANIISFGGGQHAFYTTAGVGLYALLAGADSFTDTDLANRAGVVVALAPGVVFFRQSPLNLYVELRATFPVWEFTTEANPTYIVPLMLEAGVGF